MTTDVGQWLLELIKAQGLATVLVVGAGLFIWRKVWPAVVDLIIPVWRDARQAEVRLIERQVIALERIAEQISQKPVAAPKKP